MKRASIERRMEVVDDAIADVLRRKTPAERVALVGASWRFARVWIEGAVRTQHEDWDDGRVMAEVRRRLSGGAA